MDLDKIRGLGSDVLTLNIGGKETAQTVRSTLTFSKGSKLAEMFSGRWDDSLPKDSSGNFLIGYDPEIFSPFLKYLRNLCAMVPAGSNPDPPMTPSFPNRQDELSFRRMVDSYGLTNVLYNYEIYKCGYTCVTWSSGRTLVSQDCSIFDLPLGNTNKSTERVAERYSIDRPSQLLGDLHTRRVESFEVTATASPARHMTVGWTRRDYLAETTNEALNAKAQCIVLHLDGNRMYYGNSDGKVVNYPLATEVLDDKTHHIIRCCQHRHTGELEWYADGALVAATTKAYEPGRGGIFQGILYFGWTAPRDGEMIPYIYVKNGDCCLSSLELEP